MAAINKRKLLESAQRNLQKGAVDKALKDYQTILEADPRDANVRLKIGDLQLKANKNDEAITCYLKVADQFMRDGFDAKAVAIYKQITKIDSKRQDIYVPLADLYQRLGLVSEAMAALQTAADSCHRDGRKREALDLLRRMASLDPSNTTSRLKVAQLLQQEGLTDEALAEYREAANELERQGDWEARVSVLQRILELRADDIDSLAALGELMADHGQAKRAEGFARKLVAADETRAESHELLARILTDLGQQERAIESHRHAAEAWRQRGDEDRARAIMQRYVPAEPFAPDFDPGGSPFGGVSLGTEPFAIEHEEFPVGDHMEAGRAEETPPEPEVEPPPLPPLPPRAPATLPELEQRPALQKNAPKAKAAPPPEAKPPTRPAAPAAKAAAAPAKPAPAPQKPAAAPPKQAAAPAKPAPAQAKPAPAPAKPVAVSKPAAAPTADDLDQLLAEAGVYLRYGKHERAIASLDSVLESDPEHPLALEQMGEALAATGDNERAVETWLRAAAAARAREDGDRFDSIVRRIAAVDAVAAASVAPEPPAAPRARATAAPTVLFDAGGAPADESGEEAQDESASAGFEDIEIDVDADGFLDEASDESDAAAEELDDEEAALPDETEEAQAAAGEDGEEEELAPPESDEEDAFEPDEAEAPDGLADEIDVDDFELDEEAEPPVEEPEEGVSAAPDAWELPPEPDEEITPAEPEVEPQPTPAPSELSSTTTQQILEEFEEAGFYFEQGLFDEAESIYRRILGRAPNHPGALLRLGEIAVQRGRDPGEGVGDLEPDSTDSTEQALAGKAAKPARAATAAKQAPQPAAEGAEIEPPDETDLTDRHMDVGEAAWLREGGDSDPAVVPAPVTPERVEAFAPAPQPAPSAPAQHAAAPAPPVAAAASAPEPVREEPEQTTPEVAQEGDPSGAAFDLAAELSEALATPAAARSATDEDGFESVFREFKRGVSQTLGEGDAETHFDLGIAYREMGLFDDAIGEFRYALGTPARRLDALHMMGLCALDLSRPVDAVGHFEQALASPDLPAEREVPLRFDLGRAYQAQNDPVRALSAFRRVVELDAGFQDAAQRIEALESGASRATPAAEAREAYESFDDLIAESADDAAPEAAAAPAAPSYENFDDVMAEVGDEDERASAGAAAQPEVAAEVAAPEPEPEPSADSPEKSDPADSAKPEPSPSTPRRRRKVSFV